MKKCIGYVLRTKDAKYVHLDRASGDYPVLLTRPYLFTDSSVRTLSESPLVKELGAFLYPVYIEID